MEARVARLEEDMREVRAVLARLEPMVVRMDATITAILPTLATKAELNQITATLPTLATRAELAEKPGKGYLWGVLAALLAAYAAGLAALAVLK